MDQRIEYRETADQALHRLAGDARRQGVTVFRAGAEWFASNEDQPGARHRLTGYSCTCEAFARDQRCHHHTALLDRLGWLPSLDDTASAPERTTTINRRGVFRFAAAAVVGGLAISPVKALAQVAGSHKGDVAPPADQLDRGESSASDDEGESDDPESLEIIANMQDVYRFQQILEDFAPRDLRVLPELMEIDHRHRARRRQMLATGSMIGWEDNLYA